MGYLEQQTRRYWAAAAAFQRSLALTETRDFTKARALVEELLRAEPHDLDLWLYRAQIELSANDQAAALASLETALRLGDDSVANRATCIALHIKSGSIARAMQLMQGSAARGLEYPLVEEALSWLANNNRWDDFRELAASVDRAALGAVAQSRLLTLRASLALHDGNRRAASSALQEALGLDPSNGDALLALGRIYRTERDYGRADLLFQRASSYGPVRENALVASAEIAIDQENFESAIAHLRNVVTANPARADLRRNIALLERPALLRTQR